MSQATMLFDGNCGFCRRWIARWRHTTKNAVLYRPYQEALSDFPALTKEECARAVQLILPDGRILSGAKAVFTALALGGKPAALWAHEHIPLFGPAANAAYRFVAGHRPFFSRWLAR